MWYIIVSLVIIVITVIFTKWNTIKTLFSMLPIPCNKIQNSIQDSIQNSIQDSKQDIPTVFAINDNGIFDLADSTGKILNIGFGPNPKVYINLLDQSENDVEKNGDTFTSKVGSMKTYEVGGRPYSVHFTRL